MTREKSADNEQRNTDITTVMFFLLYAMKDSPGMTRGSHKVEEAFLAACRQFFPNEDPAMLQMMMEELG